MQLPYLEHSSTRAYIGLKANRPHPEIKQHQADLNIQQEHVASFKLEITHGELRIDQSEAFADANIKGILRRNNEFIQRAKQHAIQYLAEAAQEGDTLMRIEDGYNKIPQIATRKSKPKELESVYRQVPGPFKVKFNYTPGTVKVSSGEAPLDINVTPREPDIRMHKWQTDTYLRQKNSLNFRAVGVNVNRAL